MKKKLVLFLLCGIVILAGSTFQGAEAVEAPNQLYPTFRGFWNGHFWFSWEPGSAFWGLANVNMLVDGVDNNIDLEVYDPILPQIWWRLRWPRACQNINIWRGFIGGVPIEGLPYEIDVSCQYLPLTINR